MNSEDEIMALPIPLPAPEELPEDTRKYFGVCMEKLGMVPNVLLAYSHKPDQLRAFSRFYNELMLGPSGLSELEREMIAVVVSSVNHCYYCLTAHGAAVRQYSGRPELGEQMVMNFRAADLDERQQAMLEFADKVTRTSYAIDESDRQTLRNVGFSDADIWDIANVAAFYNMTNRVASAVDMQPNAEYHGQYRGVEE